MILCDRQIKELVKSHQMIAPFVDEKYKDRGVSYGLSAASYDLRLDKCDNAFEDTVVFGLPPNTFILGCTLEHIKMPDNIVGLIKDKSTWARKGLSVFNTLIDPGFQGQITLELKNQGNELLELPRGIGIAQIMFFECEPCDVPYNGKYQGQEGVVGARVQPRINVLGGSPKTTVSSKALSHLSNLKS